MEFNVVNLDNAGFGSLRWAIDQCNAWAGSDSINFDSRLSGGTINLSSKLPDITEKIAIYGPVSNDNAPLICVDFNGHEGLLLTGRSAQGSTIKGLSLVDSGGTAITLDAGKVTIQNNYIGLALDGITAIGNQGHGILITSRSSNNLIGTLDPLTGQPLEFQFSNVISANGGSGISIQGSSGSRIANNRIGTTADGTQDAGNLAHGIHLTSKSTKNIIGGDAHVGNSPTKGLFKRPGQGNLIAGNGGSGIQIEAASAANTLSGNFIGTNVSGVTAIPNDGDGVAIIESHHNVLRGTTRNKDPFIYYNVISGNRGNGLRVSSSNYTVVHANFFGLGSDNATSVPNGLNGALIEGTSTNTQYGGVIPLGNVNAGNAGNGISVTEQARGFISFNTFAGLTAFGGIAPNGLSGIEISSGGGNTQIRTNVMSGNTLHGLHVTGDASDVWIDPNIIGLDSYGTAAVDSTTGVSWANRLDGIRIDGNSRNIRIAGQRQSVIPQNTISNNLGYGIRIDGNSSDVSIRNTYVGLSSTGKTVFGNSLGGIYVGSNVGRVTIGSLASSSHPNHIVGNAGNGVTLDGQVPTYLYRNHVLSNGGSGFQVNGAGANVLVANLASSNSLYGFNVSPLSQNNLFRLNRGKDNVLGLYGDGPL